MLRRLGLMALVGMELWDIANSECQAAKTPADQGEGGGPLM